MIKKLLLIILGIILSLVILECGLRLAGCAISGYQKYKNNKVLKNKSQYTIMCLGESTTANQYPVQLQQILNEKYPTKFSVADCGIPATNLETILDLLDDNIKKYNPSIAICMMGINNENITLSDIKDKNNSYIKKINKIKLKIIKLFLLLKQHITSSSELFAYSQSEQDLLESAVNLYHQNKIDKANLLLKNILEISEKDSNVYQRAYTYLIINYLTFMNDERGVELAINAIKRDYYDKNCYYGQLIGFLLARDKIEESKYVISLLLKDINEKNYIPNIDIYNKIEPNLTKSQKSILLNKILSGEENNHIMAVKYLKQKDYQKAKEYFDKAEEIRLNFPDIETYKLYKLIVKKLIDNNIKVICMQYPVRSVLSLQEQLKDEPYYDKFTFISNEKIFKDALIEKNYDEIFTDQFAGDFGHCTDLGNTMIAKNVVKTLEELLN